MTNMRMRVLLIGVVLLLSMTAIVPLDQRIRLGLDLQGGVRLVLRVNTDEVLQLDTQAAADRLREGLLARGARFSAVRVDGPLEFLVEGVEDANVLRGLVADDEYEQQGGGGTYVFRMRPDAERGLRLQTAERALATVERRVNELGVAEPTIVRHHRQDHIDVQLPGVSDVERARQIIRSTAQLRLTLIEQGPFDSLDAALGAYPSGVPPTLDVLPGRPAGDGTPEAYYVVQAAPALTGRDLRRAHASVDERNRPAVGFTLTADAARRFGSFTAAHVGRSLATVVDGRVRSVATIASRIDDRGQVTNLTREEMLEQVITPSS